MDHSQRQYRHAQKGGMHGSMMWQNTHGKAKQLRKEESKKVETLVEDANTRRGVVK